MTDTMRALHHVGYWVSDLDTAQRSWGRDLGVGPFEVIEHVPFDALVLTTDGRQHTDIVFDHSAAFAAWGPIVVELDQVHAIDERLAAVYGIVSGAVSHVSWVVPDVRQESARLALLGCRLITTAQTGPISVAWHDGGPLFPHPIELHQHNPVIDDMHRRLCALRDTTPATEFTGNGGDDTADVAGLPGQDRQAGTDSL